MDYSVSSNRSGKYFLIFIAAVSIRLSKHCSFVIVICLHLNHNLHPYKQLQLCKLWFKCSLFVWGELEYLFTFVICNLTLKCTSFWPLQILVGTKTNFTHQNKGKLPKLLFNDKWKSWNSEFVKAVIKVKLQEFR